MRPFFDDGQVALHQGHVLDVLRNLKAESVQCVITSPPYWALRSYGTEAQVWGGDAGHAHTWGESNGAPVITGGVTPKQKTNKGSYTKPSAWRTEQAPAFGDMSKPFQPAHTCPCGAWRGELGHEPTPQMFVQHLVQIFAEVRRVLKPDGVVFCNLGDSYSGSGKGPTGHNGIGDQGQRQGFTDQKSGGALAKSLVLIPERFALAMQDDGWYVRSRIAWCKKAPMPESVRDRPTNAWEHVWMFTRSSRYFWDADAVRETLQESSLERGYSKAYMDGTVSKKMASAADDVRAKENWRANPYIPAGRNLWNYWLLSPDPEPLAHFATFVKEVPRRCIAAATSEKGECPTCGKSWVRSVERKHVKSPVHGDGSQMRKRIEGTDTNGWAGMPRVALETTTTGWAPQCDHGLEPVPSTVLDPFVGSGTTTQVARSMFRRSIGIDLNEQYLRDIAVQKNAQMALMPPPTDDAA